MLLYNFPGPKFNEESEKSVKNAKKVVLWRYEPFLQPWYKFGENHLRASSIFATKYWC